MTRLIYLGTSFALAAVALTGLSPTVVAQPMKAAAPMHGKKMAVKTVYVCMDCKAYYSPMTAKKMGFKDSMGHALVKKSSVPAGFMDGGKMKI